MNYLRGIIELVLIIAAYWVSCRLGVKVLVRKKSFWLAVLVSILSSAFFLFPGGYYGAIYEPDAIGRGFVPFFYFILFLIVNIINIIIFGFKKRMRK